MNKRLHEAIEAMVDGGTLYVYVETENWKGIIYMTPARSFNLAVDNVAMPTARRASVQLVVDAWRDGDGIPCREPAREPRHSDSPSHRRNRRAINVDRNKDPIRRSTLWAIKGELALALVSLRNPELRIEISEPHRFSFSASRACARALTCQVWLAPRAVLTVPPDA